MKKRTFWQEPLTAFLFGVFFLSILILTITFSNWGYQKVESDDFTTHNGVLKYKFESIGNGRIKVHYKGYHHVQIIINARQFFVLVRRK